MLDVAHPRMVRHLHRFPRLKRKKDRTLMLQVFFERSMLSAWKLAHAVNHSTEALLSKYTYQGGECCFKNCPVYLEYLLNLQYRSDKEQAILNKAHDRGLI